MKISTRSRNIDTIFVLIVFSIFAFSVLMVLMLGASIYRNVNDISREGQHERTVLSYVRTKIRNYDVNSGAGSAISVADFNGVTALSISEMIGDTEYQTIIYNYDGWLYELFSEESLDFSPSDGVRIIRINDVNFEEIDHELIRVSVGDMSLLLSPRT